jgi:mono/diheme cytochrome c family protein
MYMPRLPRLAASAAIVCFAAAASPAGHASDHAAAQAALSSLKAAAGLIVSAEDSFDTNPATYRASAQKAINALVGERDPLYVAAAGKPEDAMGAIARIDALLDRTASPVWVPALQAAEVNERAAVGRLQAAAKARELNDFQTAASQALINLEVAQGRATDATVFGGLEGALATTELGLPDGVHTVDACGAPVAGWGVHGGYLGFVALDRTGAPPTLTAPIGVSGVMVKGGIVVLQTAAWPIVAKLCSSGASPGQTASPATHAAAPTDQSSKLASTQQSPTAVLPPTARLAHSAASSTQANNKPAASLAPGQIPKLYTEAQAEAGEKIYTTACVSCHGPDLHGRAGPAVAGTDFLTAAQNNEWTLQQIRYIVTTMMPLNAAGSLTPEQYADVMAYLLASNCMPDGSMPFPQDDRPDFADINFAPSAAPAPGQNNFGVCPVK